MATETTCMTEADRTAKVANGLKLMEHLLGKIRQAMTEAIDRDDKVVWYESPLAPEVPDGCKPRLGQRIIIEIAPRHFERS